MAGNGVILIYGEVAQILKSIEKNLIEHVPDATFKPSVQKTMEYVDHFKKGDEITTLTQMRE